MADQKNPRCDGMGNHKGDHCCYLGAAGVCPFLLIDDPDLAPRKYACGLLKELKNWNAVYNDPRYINTVKPVWVESGAFDCGDWPGDPQTLRADVIAGRISPEYGCCLTRDLAGTIVWPPGSANQNNE